VTFLTYGDFRIVQLGPRVMHYDCFYHFSVGLGEGNNEKALGFRSTVKPATHEPGIRGGHLGRTPGFSDTRAVLSGPGHPARTSGSSVVDTRRDKGKHCIAMLFVADSRADGSCVARPGCPGSSA